MTSNDRANASFLSFQAVKSFVYLLAISAVMIMILFTKNESLTRNSEKIVSYLANYTAIPNAVTSVILGTRLFDTIGEVTVFTIAGLGVKILLHEENTEENFIAIDDRVICMLLELAALLSGFLAIDLAIKGHLTPGGGFASGVAGATAITLLMVTGRLQQVEAFYFGTNAAALEKAAIVVFMLLALGSFSAFLHPSSLFAMIPPNLYIPALNVVAALKVTIGSWSILRLFVLKRGVL